jgi:hypothetical protein
VVMWRGLPLMDNGCMRLLLMGDASAALFDWLQEEGVRVLPV